SEVAHLHVVLRKQQGSDGFSANDFLLPILQRDTAQRGVTEGVITQFKSIVQPHAESLDSLIYLSRLSVKLLFIDKSDGWNFLITQRPEKLRGHVQGFASRHACAGGGQIVDGDGDFAPWGLRTEECNERQRRQQNHGVDSAIHASPSFFIDISTFQRCRFFLAIPKLRPSAT